MDKNYIERCYRQAILEFQCGTEAEKWEARATMARLEAIAAEIYGFDYADSLSLKEKN